MEKKLLPFLSLIFCFSIAFSQELYVGSGAKFHVKKDTEFTTSNTVVTIANKGKFSLEAGSNWGDAEEYVAGKVIAYGSGVTKLPVGTDGVYAPVIADHKGKITAKYFYKSPKRYYVSPLIADVSNTEYWKLTGNAVITLPWEEHSNVEELVRKNGNVFESVAIVGSRYGYFWDLVSRPTTNTVEGDATSGEVTSDSRRRVRLKDFGQITLGIDRLKFFRSKLEEFSNSISIIQNPIQSGSDIQFKSDSRYKRFRVTIHSISGRRLAHYRNVQALNGIGVLRNPNLETGVYVVKFYYKGNQAEKKIIIK